MKVLPVTLTVIAALPVFKIRMPSSPVVMLVFEKVLPVMLNDVRLTRSFSIRRLVSAEPVMVELLIPPEPPSSMRSMPRSPTALPLPVTSEFASVKPVTRVPRMPSSPPPPIYMRVRLTPPPTLVSRMPAPVEFWMAPAVAVAADVTVPPLPVTVRPPTRASVGEDACRSTPPLAEMLWKLRSDAPIVVLRTLSAVPVVEAMVLPRALHSHRAAAGGGKAGAAGRDDVEAVARLRSGRS